MAIKSKFLKSCLTTRCLKKIILIFVSFCILAAGLIYWWAGEQTKDSLIEQTLYREQIIAKSGARSIESFINLIGSSLLTYDHLLSEAEADMIDETLNDFIEKWSDTSVSGFILIDKDGVIKSHASKNSVTDVGISVEDRSYFRWARWAGDDEVYISKPLISRIGASRGKYVVAATTPVIKNEEFDGALTVGLLLSDITKQYLDPLKISKSTYVYLIDSEGTMLHSPDLKLVGENYFNTLSSFAINGVSISKDFQKTIKTSDGGRLIYTRRDSNPLIPSKQLLSYSKVSPHSLVGQKEGNIGPWYIIIETPNDDADAFFGPFRDHLVLMLFFAIFLILGLFAIGLVIYRIAQRDAYLDGFMHGRKHRNKK